MASYYIPRNTKGEGRILYVFSTKALIYSFVGILIGSVFYFILKFIGFQMAGIIVASIFGLIGFSIGTFKIPRIKGLKITENIRGEKIDDIIIKYFKFKTRKVNKYSLFTKEEDGVDGK